MIPEEIVDDYKIRIKLLLEDARIGPELKIQDFDEYMPLINKEAEEEVNEFLQIKDDGTDGQKSEKYFLDYVSKILEYKEIAGEIPLKKEHVVNIGMYEIHREDLIEVLVDAALETKDKLIQRCTSDYQTKCKM